MHGAVGRTRTSVRSVLLRHTTECPWPPLHSKSEPSMFSCRTLLTTANCKMSNLDHESWLRWECSDRYIWVTQWHWVSAIINSNIKNSSNEKMPNEIKEGLFAAFLVEKSVPSIYVEIEIIIKSCHNRIARWACLLHFHVQQGKDTNLIYSKCFFSSKCESKRRHKSAQKFHLTKWICRFANGSPAHLLCGVSIWHLSLCI